MVALLMNIVMKLSMVLVARAIFIEYLSRQSFFKISARRSLQLRRPETVVFNYHTLNWLPLI
jgi:hypothetical protein